MNRTVRIRWIDSLRALAAMTVVLMHTIHGWMADQPEALTGVRWLMDQVLLDTAVQYAVPVFVMISGFLLLDPDKIIDLKKIKRYALRMAAVLLSVGYAYCLIESVVQMGSTDLPMLAVTSFRNLLEGKNWAHMWYVYMLIGLYLLTPALRVFVKHAEPQTLRFTLIVLGLLTVLRPTINGFTGLALSPLIPIWEPYLLYYLMGFYVRNHPISRKASVGMIALGVTGNVLLLLRESGGPLETTAGYAFVALYSIGIFTLAHANAVFERMAENPVIASISKYSFGIYLFHPFFLNLLNKGMHIYPSVLPLGAGELAFFAAALLGAWCAAWALTRIKAFRWLLL